MGNALIDIVTASVQLYAIIDPVGSIPLLVNIPELDRYINDINRLVAYTVPSLLLLFAFMGPYIFMVFSININDFRIAGGIILLSIAIDILREGTPRSMSINPEEYIIVPIITPMLVGPGAITSVMIMATYYRAYVVILAIAIASLATYVTIKYSIALVRLIGVNAIRIFSRFFSLIVAAWAIQLITEGIMGIVK